MKLRQQQINKIEQLLDALEEKLEKMEQQEYMSFDLGKDLQSVSFMLDKIREEIENVNISNDKSKWSLIAEQQKELEDTINVYWDSLPENVKEALNKVYEKYEKDENKNE